MGPARWWRALVATTVVLGMGTGSASASQVLVKDLTLTTTVGVDERCDYPDIDPCDDNEGGWRGESLRATQHSSASFSLAAKDIEAFTGTVSVPVNVGALSHDVTSTLVQVASFCHQTITDTEQAPPVTGANQLEAGFRIDVTNAKDPKVELATDQRTSLNGIFGAEPLVDRKQTVTGDDPTTCGNSEATTQRGLADTLNPLIDRFGTSSLTYQQDTQPVERTSTCDEPGHCVVRLRGGETWTIGGKDVVVGNVTATETTTWELELEIVDDCTTNVERLRVGKAIAVGCFKRVRSGLYVTKRPAEVGGFSIDPAPKLTVDTHAGKLSGLGTVSVGDLPVPLVPSFLPTAKAAWNLTFAAKNAAPFLRGLPIAGGWSGKWIDGGEGFEATVTVDIEALAARSGLDVIFEGGNFVARPGGSLTFRGHNGDGLDLRGAEIRIGEVSLLPRRWNRLARRFSIKNARLTYEQDGASDVWSGEATLALPFDLRGTAKTITGRLSIRDGGFASAGLTVDNLNIPIGTSPIFFQGGSVDVAFQPAFGISLSGEGSFGPRLFGKSLVDGSITAGIGALADAGCRDADLSLGSQIKRPKLPPFPFDLELNGTYCADLQRLLIESRQSAKVDFAEFGFGVEGAWDGWYSGLTNDFQFTGESKVRLPAMPDLTGRSTVSDRGISACADLHFFSGGWGYRWGRNLPEAFRGCDLSAFGSASTRRVAGRSTVSVTGVPAFAAFRVTGAGRPPRVRVTGPDGTVVESPADPGAAQLGDDAVIFPDATAGRTVVVVRAPAAGSWDVETLDGATVTAIETAGPLPPARVTGRVTGTGAKRVLAWRATPVAGQRLVFVERGADVARRIGAGSGAGGRVTFRPLPGGSPARRIEAQVVQDGLPRTTVTVARFTAPPAQRPASIEGLRAKQSGDRLRIRFRRSRGAVGWLVTIRGRGRSVDLLTRKPSLSVAHLGFRATRVAVAAVAADGRRAAAVSAPVRRR